MKRNSSYILREIADMPYLLPFGQMIADHRRGIQINETGAYLWELLKTDHSKEELLQCMAGYYNASPENLPLLKKDLEQFLWELTAHGILENSPFPQTSFATPSLSEQYLQIGGLNLHFIGPREALGSFFDDFVTPKQNPIHQTITIYTGAPSYYKNGMLLVRNKELTVIESDLQYILLFPDAEQILEAHLTKDGSQAVFYCMPPYTDVFRENLFHAIRLVYLYLAQKHQMFVLHSSSIKYRDRAWLFSGPSGTGKSTHANLWQELLQTPLINGDLNLLALEKGQAYIHGLPWCGTSGIYDTDTYPLGGIILLKQAASDFVETLSPNKRQLLVLQRLISPSWTADLQDQNLQFVKSLSDSILICRLCCTRESSAVTAMKAAIDSYLDTQI